MKRSGPIRRKKPIKRVNPKRRASEWKRCYESKARVKFVKSLPCAAGHLAGFAYCSNNEIDNAHVKGGGGSRKADAAWIVPLCRHHHTDGPFALHRIGRIQFMIHYGINLDTEAAKTEAAWRQSRSTPRPPQEPRR